MTVDQLAQILQSYPLDLCVVVNGYGYKEGYDDSVLRRLSN